MKRLALALVLCGCAAPEVEDPPLELFAWERGIGVRTQSTEPVAMYLWFYEWNLFGAVAPEQWSAGRYDFEREIAPDGRSARVHGPGFELSAKVESDGVALELAVENQSELDWPELAAIVPCFNPGPPENHAYELGHHRKTYLLGKNGLERFEDRAMHFEQRWRDELAHESPELRFVFSERWATSAQDCTAGLLLRESLSGGWTAGIAWNDALGVQAHNPWLCMHVAARVGPLPRGQRKELRGRIYLFPGDREEGLRRFRQDFAR